MRNAIGVETLLDMTRSEGDFVPNANIEQKNAKSSNDPQSGDGKTGIGSTKKLGSAICSENERP